MKRIGHKDLLQIRAEHAGIRHCHGESMLLPHGAKLCRQHHPANDQRPARELEQREQVSEASRLADAVGHQGRMASW